MDFSEPLWEGQFFYLNRRKDGFCCWCLLSSKIDVILCSECVPFDAENHCQNTEERFEKLEKCEYCLVKIHSGFYLCKKCKEDFLKKTGHHCPDRMGLDKCPQCDKKLGCASCGSSYVMSREYCEICDSMICPSCAIGCDCCEKIACYACRQVHETTQMKKERDDEGQKGE